MTVPTCASLGITLAAVLAAQNGQAPSLDYKTNVIIKQPGSSRMVSLRRDAVNEPWEMMAFRVENGQVTVECREVLAAPPDTGGT